MPNTYKEIKADILARITGGHWRPGGLLPGETELAEVYGVARATVNRAMRELAEEGIIERKRKSGTRVRLKPLRQARFDIPLVRDEVEATGAVYRYALLKSEIVSPPGWLREGLGLPNGSLVRHLICLHFADETPFQSENRWINLALLPQAKTADLTSTTPTEWLIAQIPYSEVEISVSATAADPETAERLNCQHGDALLQIERSTRWDDTPVTYVRLVHRLGHRMTTRY